MKDDPLSSECVSLDLKKQALRSSPLRIGVSTRALFNLEEEHEIFERLGVNAYVEAQRARENALLERGPSFEVIRRLLALNEPDNLPYVEVALLSRNAPDVSLRAFNSIEHYGLPIRAGSFTSGRPLGPFVGAWEIDLFLSNEATDVQAAVVGGAAAARLGPSPSFMKEDMDDEVRIAFDGDAVVFSAESDMIYKREGLAAFLRHETTKAADPMASGPFGKVLRKLSVLRRVHVDEHDVSRVRIAIVTARNAPAHARVVNTLRAWGTPADEAHFVGSRSKGPVLAAFGAHIFFDDQEKHVLDAAGLVVAGLVPGPHDARTAIIPAE